MFAFTKGQPVVFYSPNQCRYITGTILNFHNGSYRVMEDVTQEVYTVPEYKLSAL